MARAVGVRPPHGFDREVRVRRRSPPVRGKIVAFEHVEHLDERRSSGADRRHRDDLRAAVRAAQRRPALGRVGLEVRARDETSVRRHVLLDQPGRLALVEARGAMFGDTGQRAGEIRLHERVTGRVRHTLLRELRDRGRVPRHRGQHPGERGGQGLAQGEPIASQRDGRLDQPLPRELPVALPREVEAGHGAGHAHRQVAVVMPGRVVLPVGQEHGRRCRRRSDFAEVVGRRVAGSRAEDDEPSPADVAGRRVHDGEREGGGDSRVDGVPAGPERLHADLRRGGLLGDHHAVRRAHRLGRGGHGHGRRRDNEHDPGSTPFHRSDPFELAVSGPAGRQGHRAHGQAAPASWRRSRRPPGR